MAEQSLDGGCLCGAVRFRAVGKPARVNHCHCRMCRVASGAPVVTWATYKLAAVTWTKGAPKVRRSSKEAVRGFCGECGSALYWRGDAYPELIDLTVGCFDRPEALPPDSHLWTSVRIPWLHLADADLPRFKQGTKSERENP